LADLIIVSRPIIVDNYEFKLLLFLEEVIHGDIGLEVRIQIVPDSLCLSAQNPACSYLLENLTLRIGLAEHILVFEILT